MHQLLFAGFGGQGVMLMGKILTYAGMKEEKQVMFIPSYGSEMRGGTANCSVVLSEEEIDAPVVSQPTVLVALNTPSFDKFENKVAPGGIIVLNSSIVKREPEREDIKVIKVPLNDIAKELGNDKILNMVALGTVIAATECVEPSAIIASLKETLPAHRQDLLPLNQQAIEAGMKFA